jgi:hypothetical protein
MKSEMDMMTDAGETTTSITSRVRAATALMVRELAIMERLQIADNNAEQYRANAEKAWKTAEALEARITKMAKALNKSASHLKDL